MRRKKKTKNQDSFLTPTYASRYMDQSVAKHQLPDESMPPEVASQLIHDELQLDGRPPLNLASFVTTWMEPEAHELMQSCLSKNLVDHDEYPFVAKIQERCVNMLAKLFHAEQKEDKPGVGTATAGSSEAIMLAGLAMKWQWRKRREANGQSIDKPNLVMGANVQVVWEKFCRYFDVEPRYVPITEERFIICAEEAEKLLDENTIGLVAILGSTFTGEYEPVADLDKMIEEVNKKQNWNIPLHVDAASGGFVAPFAQSKLVWDFRLKNVCSINVSGHKYGLVYPGIGWVIWRDRPALPEDLIFYVNYLGGDMPTFNLNFSGPSAFVVGQYYNFLRLGRKGYEKIMLSLVDISNWLNEELSKIPEFDIISKKDALPLVSWRLTRNQPFDVFQISDHLRRFGWIVPAYTMPKNAEHIAVMRIVVREGLSMEMAKDLVDQIKQTLVDLRKFGKKSPKTGDGHKIC